MSEQISEQLGGVRGLIESSIPVLAFVLLNVLLGDSVAGPGEAHRAVLGDRWRGRHRGR